MNGSPVMALCRLLLLLLLSVDNSALLEVQSFSVSTISTRPSLWGQRTQRRQHGGMITSHFTSQRRHRTAADNRVGRSGVVAFLQKDQGAELEDLYRAVAQQDPEWYQHFVEDILGEDAKSLLPDIELPTTSTPPAEPAIEAAEMATESEVKLNREEIVETQEQQQQKFPTQPEERDDPAMQQKLTASGNDGTFRSSGTVPIISDEPPVSTTTASTKTYEIENVHGQDEHKEAEAEAADEVQETQQDSAIVSVDCSPPNDVVIEEITHCNKQESDDKHEAVATAAAPTTSTNQNQTILSAQLEAPTEEPPTEEPPLNLQGFDEIEENQATPPRNSVSSSIKQESNGDCDTFAPATHEEPIFLDEIEAPLEIPPDPRECDGIGNEMTTAGEGTRASRTADEDMSLPTMPQALEEPQTNTEKDPTPTAATMTSMARADAPAVIGERGEVRASAAKETVTTDPPEKPINQSKEIPQPSDDGEKDTSTTDIKKSLVVLFRDIASNRDSGSPRTKWRQVPLGVFTKQLGYLADEISILPPDVLSMIVTNKIPRPKRGIPPQWKESAAIGGSKDVRIVRKEEAEDIIKATAAKSKPGLDDNAQKEDKRRRMAPASMRSEKFSEDAVPRRRPPPSEGENRRRRPSTQQQQDLGAQRRDRGMRSRMEREKGRSSSRPKRKKEKDPPPNPFWPDLKTFKDLLRQEANLRIGILGEDFAETVKEESNWRLNLYKDWLWALSDDMNPEFETQAVTESRKRQRRQQHQSATVTERSGQRRVLDPRGSSNKTGPSKRPRQRRRDAYGDDDGDDYERASDDEPESLESWYVGPELQMKTKSGHRITQTTSEATKQRNKRDRYEAKRRQQQQRFDPYEDDDRDYF